MMSVHEILIEEIKHQPETVVREVLRYLQFLKQKHINEVSIGGLVNDTWEKLGPTPEVDYSKLPS